MGCNCGERSRQLQARIKQVREQKKNRITFVIGCHDKITELLCHLEILSCYPFPHYVKVVYSGDKPLAVDHIKVEPVGHLAGSLVALQTGLKACSDGILIYRNADDWLFNANWVLQNVQRLRDGNFDFAGYSWFGKGKSDYALNECVLDVQTFLPFDIEIPTNLINSESPFGHYVNGITKNVMRLEGREVEVGVGNEYFNRDNNRFFNRQWQLIGSHSDTHRKALYQQIRPFITYRSQLEAKPNFRHWLSS